jgi:glycosyltransferase involved in cell wall biosynthesis
VEPSGAPPIHILAVIEATSITGPAKNLLQFGALAKIWARLSIVTFQRPGDPPQFVDAARNLGIEVYTVPERGRFDGQVVGRLRATVLNTKPDLIQTHAVKSHFVARRAGLPAIAPWIAFHHGYTWPTFQARLVNQLDRWSLRGARQIVTVSQSFQRELEGIGIPSSKIDVLGNAIDPLWASPSKFGGPELKAKWNIPLERPVLLIVGRLSSEKDHITMLDALARIHRGGHSAPHLVIVGEGPERPRIEAYIRALQLGDFVALTGQVASAEPFYTWADVAVLSSRSEGSPNALLEAMAARVPVVATEVGGIPEMVTDRESARLVAAGDSNALAGAIEEILSDSRLAARLAATARTLAETRYSPIVRADQLERIYRRVLAGAARPV